MAVPRSPSLSEIEFPVFITTDDLSIAQAMLEMLVQNYKDDPAFKEFHRVARMLLYTFGGVDADGDEEDESFAFVVKMRPEYEEYQTVMTLEPEFPVDEWVLITHDEYEWFKDMSMGRGYSRNGELNSFSVQGLECKVVDCENTDWDTLDAFYPEIVDLLSDKFDRELTSH